MKFLNALRQKQVASRAIQLAIRNGSFKAPDVTQILSDPPSRQTTTRVLRQLESDGWLERREANSSIWRAGPIARRLGNMGAGAKASAEREPIGPRG